MPERPLILFGKPTLLDKDRLFGGGEKFYKPTYDRQVTRMSPQFEILRNALERGNARVTDTANAIDPEYTLVFETIGDPSGFATAIESLKEQYPNVEWIMELSDHCPNSDDFYVLNKRDERDDNKQLLTKIFCIMTNQEALSQILSLWNHYSKNPDYSFDRGFTGFRHLFETLNDVHQWGVQERLCDTGLLDIWRDELEDLSCQDVNVQIELFFRSSGAKRMAAEKRISDMILLAGGSISAVSLIPEIGYHALLAKIPRQLAERIVNREEVDLVLAEEIMFMKATGQGVYVGLQEAVEETFSFDCPERIVEEPIVALFDGMPQENHPLLSGLLSVDDPENVAELYPVEERIHGTSMASLVLRGQNMGGIKNEIRKIYVRPIMKSRRDFNQKIEEYIPDDFLLVDKLHQCVRRLFEPVAGRVAPSVKVINLSIGIAYREYYNMISPLARLLDWLSYKYRILFVVSAGNHVDSIPLGMEYRDFANLTLNDKDKVIVQHIADNIRNFRVLSPAESMNALTVGALFSDTNNYQEMYGRTLPQSAQIPAAYSSFGRGINSSIKPDILYNGGRNLVRENPVDQTLADWIDSVTREPGIRSAYPGNAAGTIITGYSCGTSNAAALITNQAAECYDIINSIFVQETGSVVPQEYAAVLIKAMLAHGASWGDMKNVFVEGLALSGNQTKNTLHKYLGYGRTDVDSVKECAKNQATLIGFGEIKHGQAFEYEVPLPFDFHTQKYQRKLTVTLAYFSPVRPSSIKYREAEVWCTLQEGKNVVGARAEYDFHAVLRGSLQHEVFETDAINVWDEDSGSLRIKVNCRNDAAPDKEDIFVPYAIMATFEMAPEYEIDVYQRVVERVRIRETITPPQM